MKINLSEYNVYEKFEWIEQFWGDYNALDSVLKALEAPGVAVERLVEHFNVDNEHVGDDLLAWFLEGSQAWEALEYWEDCGYDVGEAVDEVVEAAGLDEADDESDYKILEMRNRA